MTIQRLLSTANISGTSLSRSRFIFFLVLGLTFVGFLVGCGGRGTQLGVPSYTQGLFGITVSLPPGSVSEPVQNLLVWTSGGETTPSPTGETNISIYNGGPQYTDASDSQGRMVLAGFLGTDRLELSVESTAELLTFFYIGGAQQIDGGGLIMLEGIETLAGFSDVVTEVTSQLQTIGYVDVEQPALKSALEAIAGTFAGRGRGTIAIPTSDSGISLDTSIDGELKITNVYLRRLIGFLQRTGYRDASNQFVADPGPVTQFNVNPPKRFAGTVGTITDLGKGEIAYSPVVTDAFAIPFEAPDGMEATVYELRMGGLGIGNTYPNLLQGDELSAYKVHVIKAMLLDIIFPVIIKIILPVEDLGFGAVADFAGSSPVFTELLNTILLTAPGIYDLASAGKNQEAAIALYEAMVNNGIVLETFARFITVLGEHFSPKNFFTTRGSATDAVLKRLRYIGIADLIVTSADMILSFADIGNSEMRSKFEILSTPGKATIVPQESIVSLDGQGTTMQAVIQDKDPNAVYRYEWSVTEGYTLTNSTGSTSTAPNGILVSSSDLVAIFDDTGKPGTATVTCNIVRINGLIDKPLDKPTVDIRFVEEVSISPNPANVNINSSITLTGDYKGEEPVYWRFLLANTTYGTIDRTSIGNSPSVTFKAGSKSGTVTLTAECFLDAEGKLLIQSIEVPITVSGDGGVGVELRLHSASKVETDSLGNKIQSEYVTVYSIDSHAHHSYWITFHGSQILFWTSPDEPPLSTEFLEFVEAYGLNLSAGAYFVELETRKVTHAFPDPNFINWIRDNSNELQDKWYGENHPLYYTSD